MIYINIIIIIFIIKIDLSFIFSIDFVWKVAAITVVSCLPLYIIKKLKRCISPPKYLRIRD